MSSVLLHLAPTQPIHRGRQLPPFVKKCAVAAALLAATLLFSAFERNA